MSKKQIPYGRQEISESDIQAVVEVLRSDWLTQGPTIEKFERAVAEYCGASYAVAVSSATGGLHLAMLAMDLGPESRVWTSPNTFVASANCARYCGAQVDFVDIDPSTYNIDLDKLEAKLENAQKLGQLPDVLVPVHFGGQACDLSRVKQLSKKFGFKVVEDAAHAIGGMFQKTKIGSCAYSDFVVFSFHPVKVVTTGEGGMILTNSPEFYSKLLRLRTHGITRLQQDMKNPSDGPWYYEQIELGYHYRMTDIQAALGLSQLTRLDAFVRRRNELADRYDQILKGVPLKVPGREKESLNAFHLYVVRLELNRLKKSKAETVIALRNSGIGVNLHYIPVYFQPYYKELGFKKGYCPESERYYEEALTLPLYPSLTHEDQDYVVQELNRVFI